MKKLQIFVSSTYLDLKEERQAAVEAILKAGHIPAGMELFASGDRSQWETIKSWIDESDIFLLILGGRYGSLEQTSSLSYTECEYDYAVSTGKKFFAVVITEGALDRKIKILGKDALELENAQKLKIFREKVLTKTASFFDDPKDITISISNSIGDFIRRYDFKGWISGAETPDSIITFDEFYKGFQYAVDKYQSVDSLNIYAFSTSRFVRQVADRPSLKIEQVKIILPSEDAIGVFYSHGKGRLIEDPRKAVKSIKNQIRESIGVWENLEKIKKVGSVDISYIDTFPMFYLVIIDMQTCFYGYNYVDKSDFVNGISIGPTYVLEGKDKGVQIHVDWFHSTWRMVSAKNI